MSSFVTLTAVNTTTNTPTAGPSRAPLAEYSDFASPVAPYTAPETDPRRLIPMVVSAPPRDMAPRKNKRKIEELEANVARLEAEMTRQAEEYRRALQEEIDRAVEQATAAATAAASANKATSRRGNQPKLKAPLKDYYDNRIAQLNRPVTERDNARGWNLDDSAQGPSNKAIFDELVTFANEFPRDNLPPMSSMSGSQLQNYIRKNKQTVNSFYESAKRRRDRSRAPADIRESIARNKIQKKKRNPRKDKRNQKSSRVYKRRS
ncbi:hypothetical protein G6F56_012832 [Rhizopus delemar]|nr:hypothetical protein G6F56_012832 [Rhizopus delemar]